MDIVTLSDRVFTKKTVVIMQFGPATATSGFRPGEYFQVTIDPSLVSPDGKFLRFGKNTGDEVVGWQRIDAITLSSVLTEWPHDGEPEIVYSSGGVTMRVIE
jgi:hypothetical protein